MGDGEREREALHSRVLEPVQHLSPLRVVTLRIDREDGHIGCGAHRRDETRGTVGDERISFHAETMRANVAFARSFAVVHRVQASARSNPAHARNRGSGCRHRSASQMGPRSITTRSDRSRASVIPRTSSANTTTRSVTERPSRRLPRSRAHRSKASCANVRPGIRQGASTRMHFARLGQGPRPRRCARRR